MCSLHMHYRMKHQWHYEWRGTLPKMTAGQALIQSLYREGIRVIFGVPGVQMYHATDPIIDQPGMRFITVRHEQATAYMADGFTRAGGGIGMAMVVPGPGLLNASAAIGTAFAASSPILVLSGQIQKDLIGVDRGILHEVNDQIDTIRPITKAAYRIMEANEVPAVVHEAFRQLKTGRPRPVEIEIPPETLGEVADIDLLEPGDYQRLPADTQDVQLAADEIIASNNPLIWAGGGIFSSEASNSLLNLAEFLQSPVMTTHEGKGAIPDSHYLSIGTLKSRSDDWRPMLKEYDLVIAVGTRFATADLEESQRVIQIDIDPQELGRNHRNTLGITGDAKGTLELLKNELEERTAPRPNRRNELEKIRTERFGPDLRIEPLDSYMRAIREAIPGDGILVAGMTQMGYYSRLFYSVEQPNTYLNSSYFGNLGFAWPTALGAKVAQPEKVVVCISGDGGFLFNSQELATAVQYGINAIVIVFNDNAFGNVMRDQEQRFNGRIVGAELHNPDFVKLAEAYGAIGVKVSDPDQLKIAITNAINADLPTLIEVPMGPVESPL